MKKMIVVISLLACWLSAAFIVPAHLSFQVPDNWPAPRYDFSGNPLSAEKILLGRALFYDPVLSRDSSVSCASCHSQYTAFAHVDHSLSHGIDDRIGKRNAPVLVNLAWQQHFMWDGAVHHLDMQALAPISNHDEMDETIGHVITKLQRSQLYPGMFYRAFGDSIITGAHILKAMAQFMVCLVSAEARYDRVMRKEDTFTTQEANGYRLFRQHCASCHREPLFTNGTFADNGLPVDTNLRDYGRVLVTHAMADSFQFKIPSLRNIEFSYPYMHDGRFKKLSQVIRHYVKGIQRRSTLARELQAGIALTDSEQVDLHAFLLTLTDKKFLFNTAYAYPHLIFSDKREGISGK